MKIASLLSFVAGMVNVSGFLSIKVLTTNVTGHFAFFVDEVFRFDPVQGLIYFLYIFFFFAGSFASGFLVELAYRRKNRLVYVIPVLTESIILLLVACLGWLVQQDFPQLLAFLLLFAMGLQNSLVTSISNAVVRTTHLTGLFTDLGIELSQLFFYRQHEQRKKLRASIRLRLTIISFFFLGGITGGVFYSLLHLQVLLLAVAALWLGISFDVIKLRLIRFKRRSRKS